MAAPSASNAYDVVCEVIADGNVTVKKCKSRKTGINVFIANVEGPLVNGYFCLATEAHDDDGLPHTLEHLVFMGSEDYPYKGVLDLLANRCLASGTNAWTDTDHTCYTMTNAGSHGFLNLLPIYMDHILYPTLTESGYITEVHHVNGEGEDGGVVYCEMQARENTGESRTHLEMIRAVYPGHCGYKSETGGIMKNLRESTSHEKVCAYHRQFYRPDNICLIITGQINPDDVFKALQPLEEKILSKGSLPEFTRPWQTPVPPLEGATEQVVRYSADDEDHGIVNVAWRGPAAKDHYMFESVNMFMDYLTDSPISPLQRDFVEIDDPYCSDVHGYMMENSECCMYFKFDNVAKEKLKLVHPRLQEVLKKIASGTEKIDMTRMGNLIHRKVLDSQRAIEDKPHDTMAMYLIGDFLFGDDKKDLEARVKMVELFTKMKTENETYWRNIVNTYMIDKPRVLIIGEPSKALMEEMGKAEADRVAKQREELGKDGLQKKAEAVEKATEENEKEAPEKLLTSVAVPDVGSIYFHPIVPYCNRAAENGGKQTVGGKSHPAFPLDKIPFRFQLDDIHTNFVQMNVLMDSSCVPQDLKYYLPLFCEVLFECPILRDGELVPHEEVISQLEADTLSTYAGLGVQGTKFNCGYFPQVVHVRIQVEREKYARGVQWLREILYQTRFTAERLRTVAKKMNNDIAKYKRKGMSVIKVLFKSIMYKPDCNNQINSMLRQNKFLEGLISTLESSPQTVEQKMSELRALLTGPCNLTVHMGCDVAQLTGSGDCKPQDCWADLVPAPAAADPPSEGDRSVMKKTYEYILSMSESKLKSAILGVGSVESSYLIQAVPCVNAPLHKDLPAIMVFIQYLTQLEGPMWRQIRGLGLAYHYSMYAHVETGLLVFLIARSTHVVNAFKEGRDIVTNYVNGTTEFSEVELESAKSSLTFEVIERETTVSDVSFESLLSYYKEVPHTYNKDMLKGIAAVTLADLKCVGKDYISALFDESQVRRAVCCHPSKVKEITESFKELGVNLHVIPSIDDEFLCSL